MHVIPPLCAFLTHLYGIFSGGIDMKKYAVLSLIFISLCCLLITPVFAASTESDISPLVITACPYGNGIHQMQRRGSGSLYCNGSIIIEYGYCWQCKNCYEVMLTSDDPCSDYGAIGTYGTRACDDPISMYGIDIEVVNYYYNGSRTMDGYRFFY